MSGRPWRFAVASGLLLLACGRDDDAGIATEPPPPPPARQVVEQLPTLRLNTTSGLPVTSREVYVPATLRLTGSDGTPLQEGALEIRGRGHSTWDLMPKKPYRLKLTTSTSLLSMPASRHWVLLANYSDKTLLRNDVTFEFSRILGMAYTPRSQYVDFELNGSYQGVYQLVEHVRIAPDRVNIPELKVTDTTASAISGGYLIEIDERRGEDFCFNSTVTRMIFCVSNPETLLQPAWSRHRQYIESYIRDVDAAIFGAQFADPTTGYAGYLDVDSAINYYLINELFKNVDGNLRLSTFLYKKRDGKLTFGPIWDFDLAIGNVNYDGADLVDGWHTRTAPWFTRMFQDPAFAGRVKSRWNQMKTEKTVDSLVEYMTARRFYLSKVQVRNFQKWPILGTWVWPNRVVTGSYEGEVLAAQNWLWSRMRWMDAQFAK
jgi:hypothetical protein